ncbi:hypothetical protein SAMN04488074_12025 [Lentzea albidocapillata subsp. violacea]|uniref:Hsp70 protein n=1 Tax=Lentzea albidocapillata subsp. violacea TaxID=128104 RepID=A0A1G9SDU4_9PSEU|nr:hypothetical protein [Lentzea albidocapillata]SDM33648.1 hypothetical protein SAMN04488074_12025 [Lentzea albidocapillata subsp. violacea]
MSYQVGLDLGSAHTTVATGSGVTTHGRRHQAAAREIANVLDDLTHRHGEPPSRVAMAHPLCWPHEHLEQLRQDLINEGRADVLFVPAPHAVAIAFDADVQMPEHSTVAVFDFGASGCDVTVLRKQGVLPAGRLERVASSAGLCLPDVVLLVGGSSRIPLEIAERLRVPVLRAPDGAAATGAYLEARQLEPDPVEQSTVEMPVPRQEEQKKRIPTTPFIAAGLLGLVLGGGWFAHEAMNQPQVRTENTSVQLEPPGTAELPRITEPGR